VSVAFVVVVAGAVLPCVLATMRGGPLLRLAALQALGVAVSVAVLLFAAAVDRVAYVDAALVVALLSLAGSLVFARFFGHVL
jgi:multicomponent Na+:H+ antiporter subunit F